MRLHSLPKRIYTRLLLEVDQLCWRFQSRGLRRVQYPTCDKVVLFCDVMTMPATAKFEAMIAAALRQKGYRAVVLLSGQYSPIESCFSATGPIEFRYLDKIIDHSLEQAISNEVDVLIDSTDDINSLASFETEGFRVGRYAQSKVVRQLRIGRLRQDNPIHVHLLREALVDSLLSKEAAVNLLANINPDLAVFNEKGYTPAGEIFAACLANGTDCIQWLGAPQSDHMLFKRYNQDNQSMHPLSLSDESWTRLSSSPWPPEMDAMLMEKLAGFYTSGAWFNRQQLQVGKRVIPKGDVLSTLNLDPSKKTAVIFAQIFYDATFFFGESLFSNYEEWLVETVREAIKNTNLNWVIKVHPVNVWRSKMDKAEMVQLEEQALRTNFGELPSHISIMRADTEINTYSLFSAIDYGLTVRGTIGMELPCYGIPTVLAGTGRYSDRGFTVDPTSRDEYRKILSELHKNPPLDDATTRLARKYAYGTFFQRPIPMTSIDFDYQANTFGLDALAYNTRLMDTGAGKNLFGDDIQKITDWMATSTSEDLTQNA